LQAVVSRFLAAQPTFQTAIAVTPQDALLHIREALGSPDYDALSEHIADITDMFCQLFELSHVGIRVTALDKAMCPKFHVDKVPCRLVTTYQGSATEWLPHHAVDRSKLGPGSQGLPDNESGLYKKQSDIQQLQPGDVALLKGELWDNNDPAGLVHRSPEPSAGEHRLLLTLDFVN